MTTGRAAALAVFAAVAIAGCEIERSARDDGRSRTERRIDEQLIPAREVPQKEGLAAAILIDVSGSMEDEVRGENGREEKIEIARRAARDLVEQFARYADDHPDEPVLLGLYEFSERNDQPDCRVVIPMGRPDRERAERALARMRAQGGTPIGNAMITAKRELDETGLVRRHLLVVTDGENTDGFAPHDVTAAIHRRPEAERPSIYFVAFDIEERRFTRVRDAGALLLGAADARELNATLDSLLRGQILVEK
ncbi:MAG TPA: vWA domain-containing protein [Vicinamibacterales bacterium]